ncbi:hypothetical protein HU200_018205 [Digitaria exilis]|uniref:Uncharacterized protein n=1 Tax=Digitaria exilis TaxID=1010633 RepID=A0A835KGR2_9POAL|nr:hypothetical protein HU200_018205 [Digitaria exilis]
MMGSRSFQLGSSIQLLVRSHQHFLLVLSRIRTRKVRKKN